MNWLKHAFAIDVNEGEDVTPSAEQTDAIDRVMKEIHRRKMSVPSSMFLETCRPLNYVGSQLLVFFSPILKVTLGINAQDAFARFLEQRGSIDYLLRRLEELDPRNLQEQTATTSATDGNDE